MKSLRIIVLIFLGLGFILSGCEKEPFSDSVIEAEPSVVVNPNGVAPLAAKITLRTEAPVSVEIRVPGKNGPESDLIHRFSKVSNEHTIPVLGLYPDYDNRVELTFYTEDGRKLDTQVFVIRTRGLIDDLPQIEINVSNPSQMTPGYNLVNYFGHNGNFNPQRAFMFDRFGDIRWYLDYSEHPVLDGLFYDNGMTRLGNGNLLFGDGNTNTIYEIDMLGEIVFSWPMPGYGFHHHVIEKPDGNLLVTVNDGSLSTVEDVILELNRTSGNITNKWDLNESLDNQRRAWETDLANLDIDWFHANGLEYDQRDNTIIVSGRTQGTVKFTEDNQVVWILAPHKEWETSGRGDDLNQFLLQPLDAAGQPITDQAVLNGEVNHPDFEWPWYQHSPILLPNGNLMLFDNGENRNYQGIVANDRHSRAVEYKIDEQNMTIQQVWSYGKERGLETYSRIVSKVSYYEQEQNVLFTPGAVLYQGINYGKVIELDHATGGVIFEATVKPPIAPFNITFHNTQRMPLYPE